MNYNEMIEAMARAIIKELSEELGEEVAIVMWGKDSTPIAEAAFKAMQDKMPDYHELHKDDKSKNIINTIATISAGYYELKNLGGRDEMD